MPNSIHKKLVYIQQKLIAPKNQFNKFGNYNYRSCEDILEGLKPLLDDCAILISDEIVEVGGRVYVKATATLTNGTESICNSAYARESGEKKGMDSSQVTGSTSSYARKYALNGLFAIDDSKDADSMDNSQASRVSTPTKKVDLASIEQVGLLNGLLRRKGKDKEKLMKFYGVTSTKLLTKAQASKAIEQLNKEPDVAESEQVISNDEYEIN